MKYYLVCWKKYADFSGRARRKEYWTFFLFNYVAGLVPSLLSALLTVAAGKKVISPEALTAGQFVLTGVIILYSLATIIPTLAVSVRRLHDTGRNGWHLFLLGILPPLVFLPAVLVTGILSGWITRFPSDLVTNIPLLVAGAITALAVVFSIIGAITLFVFYVLDSQPGPNKYGANPKETPPAVPAA